MTNLKKLGLTALAGSLVATSAFAGEMSVSGTAKVSYTSGDTLDTASTNPWSASNAISFSGGGELDNGMSVSVAIATDTGSTAFSSSSMSLDMGDAGVFAVSKEKSSGHGYNAYQDKMPTAGEEVWDDMSGEASGRVGMEDNGTISYGNALGGANVSVAYNKDSATSGSDKSIGIDYTPMDGVMIFVARADVSGGANATNKHTTFGGTYTAMGATIGLQRTNLGKAAASTDQDRTHIAASFAVNENLSVSYGMSTVEFEASGKTDQEDSGFAASYTMGSMSFSASSNKSDNAGGTSGNDDTHKEISLAFAF
jgi:outer membrane protein OmpU